MQQSLKPCSPSGKQSEQRDAFNGKGELALHSVHLALDWVELKLVKEQ